MTSGSARSNMCKLGERGSSSERPLPASTCLQNVQPTTRHCGPSITMSPPDTTPASQGYGQEACPLIACHWL